MSFSFSFATASQILFGNDAVNKVPGLISGYGRKVLIVTGKNPERAVALSEKLVPGTEVFFFSVESEPTTHLISKGTELARSTKCGVVLALGGGSVMDAGKAIAAMATNPGDLLDYLEVIGHGKALTQKSLPCIAIPTTSGTGAEVTKNSVIKSPENNVKVSLRSNFMYPDVAVVDPTLTYSMSPALTASTGLDAFTHLMETFVSNQANPFNDMICREGLQRIARSLAKACQKGDDEAARTDMSMASLLGGMALANVKLGAVHGFAGPMGGLYPIPHGTVCASLMAAVMETNIEALKEKGCSVAKYDELARILTGSELAKAEDAVVWAENLISELNVPSLAAFGLTPDDFPVLVQKAKAASSMKGNPLELNDEQLTWILEKSL
ncbi:iron-containing alcohol dehydrogenase [Maribellus sp. CM-23]|uniref:iron-containing alcohol dehydrogenase n=1 Tax=Maribellus sp. CM-23 TaxID=2781026 RepID=UPI001F3BA6E2|nr:iron-containing alcohol dehydrogenase [Maribellus sp. CM-23]MCE4563512.1 iron-containing alcohol dehydrogenase [Maribellus sp. CM-23]